MMCITDPRTHKRAFWRVMRIEFSGDDMLKNFNDWGFFHNYYHTVSPSGYYFDGAMVCGDHIDVVLRLGVGRYPDQCRDARE